MLLAGTLVLLSAAVAAAASLYTGDEHVVQITSGSFKKVVQASPRPVLVEFYSPTCPHCVNLVGVWRKVARNLAGHVVVGGVNCREDPLCGQYNVKGVPSIKLFTKDDRGKMLVLDHDGTRSVEGLVAFAKRHLVSHVVKVSLGKKSGVAALDDFLQTQPVLPHVLLFKSGTLAASMPYKTLSVDFRGRLVLGIVNSRADPLLAEKLHVKIPADGDGLVVVPPGASAGQLYKGPLTLTAMRRHFEEIASSGALSNKEEL